MYTDNNEWSIAIFWDVRLFGLAKFFDKEIRELHEKLAIDQKIELKLSLNFDCDDIDLFQTSLQDLILKGLVISH